MTKKQKVVFAVVAAVVAAVLVPGIILSYVCYHFIYGTRITSREGEAYHKLEGREYTARQRCFLPQIWTPFHKIFIIRPVMKYLQQPARSIWKINIPGNSMRQKQNVCGIWNFLIRIRRICSIRMKKIIAALRMWQWQIGSTDMNMPSRQTTVIPLFMFICRTWTQRTYICSLTTFRNIFRIIMPESIRIQTL